MSIALAKCIFFL